MDDKNSSFNAIKTFLISIAYTVQECFNEQQNYNASYTLNTNCTKTTQCEHTSMFCNETTLRCQCSKFHFWNETVGICEYKHELLTKWIESHPTKKFATPQYEPDDVSIRQETIISLHLIIVVILGAMCFLFCAAYSCNGKNEVDGDKSLFAALRKQKEQTCIIQKSIVDNI